MKQNKYKILLVDSDLAVRNYVAATLNAAGYQTILAVSCANGKTMYTSHLPDLILLDLDLPDADGLQLLDFIRTDSLTPVMILSGRCREYDKVTALDAGANDYVTKPFSTGELLARVRVALRNNRYCAKEGRLPGGRFSYRDLEIDYDARQLLINNKPIRLTQTEYNIVAFLSENCGKMMPYSAIIKAIWNDYTHQETIKKLQVNIANIRKKIQHFPGAQAYIVNEPGMGYRMNTERNEELPS